ncbi:MAG: 2-amino-4-hydroxy-6-hydroxymethyldihydropteridine diphosphokinase [Gammaproteobacteria bacterium]|nr:2-amino-4-hydroxy-6-hydroxymethyldihydropteridine diphosphokinase [Gammaproteobacteria bacterium]
MTDPVCAFVGLGSNQGDRLGQLQAGAAALARLPDCGLPRCSPVYRSAPLEVAPQRDFLNAVCALETRLSPRALLDALLGIEAAAGRRREEPGQPRVLDLDLLLYADRQLSQPGLRVPHPRLARRAFVLRPLHDLEPELVVPGAGPLAELLAAVADQLLERVDGNLLPQPATAI